MNMSLYKQAKDKIIRFMLGSKAVPSGLSDLHHYFRVHGPINFKFEKQEDGAFVAISENFRYGSIVTHSKTREDLDEKIKDAILTAFEVPSSYAKEADVRKMENRGYAFA